MDKEDVVYIYVYIHIYMYTYIYIYTMDYGSAIKSFIKSNERLPFATTWMDLEMIILSEVSQTVKDKYHMISLIRGI